MIIKVSKIYKFIPLSFINLLLNLIYYFLVSISSNTSFNNQRNSLSSSPNLRSSYKLNYMDNPIPFDPKNYIMKSSEKK